MAINWLDNANFNNRAVREDYVERIANDMINGRWDGRNGEPIKYHLRRFLLSQRSLKPGQRRSRQEYVLALAIKAWNACKNEQKMKALSFRVGEPFPQL